MSDFDSASEPGPESGSGDYRNGDVDGDGTDTDTANAELPDEVIEEAERLTRLARTVVDEDEADHYRERRADVLEGHAFTARVRDEQTGDVLVLHPEEWHDTEEGVIRTDRIDDLSRAVEIPLEGPGPGEPENWDDVDGENRELVDAVRDAHGDVHGDNASTFADFMGNHYARPMISAEAAEIEEFLTEYYIRNAWPSDEQRVAIEESIRLVFETAGEPVPEFASKC